MVSETLQCTGTVRVAMYDSSEYYALAKMWREMRPMHQLELTQHLDPIESHESTNTTCVGLHEWLVDSLNGATAPPTKPSGIALGRDGTTVPTSSDTSLNDHVETIDITQFADEGTQVRVTAFVGEDEANVDVANGETISEMGIYAGSRLLNHSTFSTDYEKDDTKTMTVEGVLSFSAA